MAFEGDGTPEEQRDPIPAELADQVAAVDGVAAIEPLLLRYAQLVDTGRRGDHHRGRADYGTAWTGDASLVRPGDQGRGRAAVGPDEVAIDKATADREDFAVGDTITVLTDTGTAHVHDHGPRRPRRQRRLRRRHARRVGRRPRRPTCSAPAALLRRHRHRRRRGRGRRHRAGSHRGDPAAGDRGHHPRRADRRERGATSTPSSRLPDRPADLRLHHGVRQRLPHQQRLPDHDRPTAARAGAAAGGRRLRAARCGG